MNSSNHSTKKALIIVLTIIVAIILLVAYFNVQGFRCHYDIEDVTPLCGAGFDAAACILLLFGAISVIVSINSPGNAANEKDKTAS